MKRVSFLTPTLDAAATLATTIESIRREAAGIEYEHLIIDGLSTDGTRSLVEREAAKDRRIRFLPGKDSGAYDAMNRGIGEARGEMVAVLNADDHYLEGGLEPVLEAFDSDPNLGVVAASLLLRYPDGRDERRDPEIGLRGRLGIVPPIWHPSTFVRRGAYESTGLYDLRYPIAADIEWAFRALDRGVRFRRLDHLSTRMLTGGLSTRAYHHTALEMLEMRRRRRGWVGRISHFLYYKNPRLRKCRATPGPRWTYWKWALRDWLGGGPREGKEDSNG